MIMIRIANITQMLGLISLILSLHSCSKDPLENVEDPDEVIEIPGFDGEGLIVPVKINNQNKIIGYYQPGEQGPDANDPFDGKRQNGFLIQHDGEGFVPLNQPSHVVNRPRNLNDHGLIVGEFITEDNYNVSANLSPTYAFSMNADGTDFKNLHPSNAYYSSATHVTDHPSILGHYSTTEQGSVACIFRGDSVADLVDSNQLLFSRVHAVNQEYAILYTYNGNIRQYYAYHFQDESLALLDIHSLIADMSSIYAVNDQGIAVGYSVDFSQSDAFIGMMYDMNNQQLTLYKNSNNVGGSTFIGYKFMDINEKNIITGIAERPYEGGFLQSRAMLTDKQFHRVWDITPYNGNAYSEMVSLNDNGKALGYLGIPKKNQMVNKMMVIDVNSY